MTTLNDSDNAVLEASLNQAWKPDETDVAAYRRDGFIRLRNFLSPHAVEAMHRLVLAGVHRHGRENRPLAERDAYAKAFIQVTKLGFLDAAIDRITRSARFASAAAALMEVPGVRLWHDQALYKEAGGDATPMHTDWHYIPTEPPLCGIWIPLHDVPIERGALCYAPGTHRHPDLRQFPVSMEADRELRRILAERGIPQSQEGFSIGDIGVHDLRTVHWTAANTSGADRCIFNIFYVADGAIHASEPVGAHQHRYWPAPEQTPGQAIGGHLHPRLWPRTESTSS